jgi:hypothetical protein
MHQRVADHAAEKATREKLQEEVEEKQRKIEKLKERHEAMVGASSGKHGVSATEYALQQERDKLFVSIPARARARAVSATRADLVRNSCGVHAATSTLSNRSSRAACIVSR